ncbi:MAG TPA: GreA/GreB family elongation factor [Polyangiales bacterium]
MPLPEKQRVLEAVLDQLAADLSHATQAAEETRRDATHEEAKPENDKDTRALEQSYLARGQALRAEQLAEEREVLRFLNLPAFEPDAAISAGALVELEDDDGGTRVLFMLPHAGGTEVSVDGVSVLVVTAASPLGAALLGRGQGDDVSLRTRDKRRNYVISEVR